MKQYTYESKFKNFIELINICLKFYALYVYCIFMYNEICIHNKYAII